MDSETNVQNNGRGLFRYCINCDKRQPYEIRERYKTLNMRGCLSPYLERYAVCKVCGEELYVPEINDMNVSEVERAFRALEGDDR